MSYAVTVDYLDHKKIKINNNSPNCRYNNLIISISRMCNDNFFQVVWDGGTHSVSFDEA